MLNRIDMKTEYIERVREGFYRVMHGSHGTARAFLRMLRMIQQEKQEQHRHFMMNQSNRNE